ncbi:CRLF3 factor, partial [Atractosteus spatula]|nr:CRLF3 factor [Atractosteus spatula]
AAGRMSIEVEALLQEAKESIEAAQNYRSELQLRLQGLVQARKQIRGSATQTREVLKQHFQELQGSVSRLLGERLAELLREVDAIEQESVRPLDDCQKLIENGVSTADELLREGSVCLQGVQSRSRRVRVFAGGPVPVPLYWTLLYVQHCCRLKRQELLLQAHVFYSPAPGGAVISPGEGEAALRCGIGEKDDKLGSFTKKALQIQLDSLPEVPSLVEVPCLSAQLDDSLLPGVKERIFSHGSVASHPPVQIDELVERPGGILVRWCKVDDDFVAQDYRLQYRRGAAGQYEEAYIGKETEFIVLHIDPHTDYLFRVCARGDGRREWSPWSIPQTACTTLAPHEWRVGSEGYSLSSRRNIALRNDMPPARAGVLYSSSPTYFCGQTLTFRIVSAGQPDRRDSVGVCVDCPDGQDSLQRDKAVCISTSGAVFVNGKEMTNQLPAVTVGSAVTFDMEVVSLFPVNNNISDGGNFKLRVTIGSGNREVVFDWVLDQGVDCLSFGCSFTYPGWKVLVF